MDHFVVTTEPVESDQKNAFLKFQHYLSKSEKIRIFLAEMLGTAVFVFLAQSIMAQLLIGKLFLMQYDVKQVKIPFGKWLSYSLSTGFAYTVAIALISGVSRGHLNPVLTLAAIMIDITPWEMLPSYCCGQCLGSFLGTSLAYSIHHKNIEEVDQSFVTSRIFASYPLPPNESSAYLKKGWSIAHGTAVMVLLFLINQNPNGFVSTRRDVSFYPFFNGVALTVLLLTNGIMAGITCNPAMDFSSRLFSTLIYGNEVWTRPIVNGVDSNFSWMPTVMPYVGAIFGTLVYAIGIHLYEPNVAKRDEKKEEKLKKAKKKIAAIEKRLKKLQ